MSNKITMDDIAEEMKVSKSLVSRALSGKYGVSDETRNKIKLTAVKLGYKFPGRKKDFAVKTESITIVIERHDLLDSGFWVKIINGIEKELNKKNISVFLTVIEDEEAEFLPLSIRQLKTNGVLICGRVPLKHIVTVSTTGLPVVTIDPLYSGLKFDNVIANNYYGAFDATELIINNGHKHIAFVGSPSYSFSFKERYRGFIDCVGNHKDLGIVINEITDDFDDYKTPFSKKQFTEMVFSKDRPTALICANDPVAFFVYDILYNAGFEIPKDFSVIGFDNVEKCDWVTPKLTTVNIPKTTMGARAVELLLKRLEEPDGNIELVSIGTEIIKRDSVRNLNDINRIKLRK